MFSKTARNITTTPKGENIGRNFAKLFSLGILGVRAIFRVVPVALALASEPTRVLALVPALVRVLVPVCEKNKSSGE